MDSAENHSLAYSMLGYLCGYLRHYYTKEFICAFLKYADNEDDINNGTELARKRNITILEPRFRYSKGDYFFDENSPTIYKGISSVKYMNNTIADELYELRDNKYDTFVDLLHDINNLSIDSRQLDILIKLDFFVEFGNAQTLNRIVHMFNFFKNGKAKTITKDKLSFNKTLQQIVARNSVESEKGYNKLNTKEILHEIEIFIRSQNPEDYTFKQKMEFQKEYVGYISLCTHNEADRRKLIITDVRALGGSKKDKKEPWAYAVFTQSIGSGKNGRFTVYTDVYNKDKIKTLDIIYADYVYPKKKKGTEETYWYLGKYHQIE